MSAASNAHELVTRLGDALGWPCVLTGAAAAPYAIQGQLPRVVALPRTSDGVSATLALASELGVSVVPWGGGTRQQLGHPPSRCDVVLSLERLARVLAYSPTEGIITCQAGITHAALAEALAPTKHMLALDVPLPERATLGGTLATATAGPRRGFYGAPRDVTQRLQVADADGALLWTGGRVVKQVTGYDMTRLYVGSLGSLGVIVEATLRLAPRPAREVTLIGATEGLERALAAARALAALSVRPSAIAVLPSLALPTLAALPALQPDTVLVAARVPGAEAEVAHATREGTAALRAQGLAPMPPLYDDALRAFWQAVTNFARLETAPGEALVRVAAPPAEVGLIPPMAHLQAREYHRALMWLLDAVAGVVWLRLGPPPDQAPPADPAHVGQALGAIQRALVGRWRTSVVLACDPALKAYLTIWGAEPAGIEMMREIKATLDPARLLNPGRFLTGL